VTSTPSGDRGGAGRTRVLFFGSGAFAVPVLDALATDPDLDVVGVVTAPDRPAGRGRALTRTPVAERAAVLGLPLLQPPTLHDAATVEALVALRPRLGVLADFGRIVPPAILAIPPAGILNVHPSLLPRHRGASPIAGAILAGDAETGVSVMAMDEGLDTGPVVAARAWPLTDGATAESVEARAAVEGAALLREVIPAWLAGSVQARPQDDAAASLTRPLRREDGRLDPALPARALERRTRAYSPWPGTFLETPAGRVAVRRAHVAPTEVGDAPGSLVAAGDGVALATAEGRLVLDEVQPAGRRPMTGADLRRGRPVLVGSRVIAPEREAAAPASRGSRSRIGHRETALLPEDR
jgi:methionyl-tRNA formyltransferase